MKNKEEKMKRYWIDPVTGKIRSGVLVQEVEVVYSADFDGKNFRHESWNKYKSWEVKGDDGKLYALKEDDLYNVKPKP